MMMSPVSRALLVAGGGLVGSVLRYWLTGAVQGLAGQDFPSGTLTVNVLGSFLFGLVMTLSLDRGVVNDEFRLLLTTGFCGGFTTMSTFSYDTMALLRSGDAVLALAYTGATIAVCLAAVWLGTAVGRLI